MTEELTTTSDELFKQFNWYSSWIANPISNASRDFLGKDLEVKLVSVSKNVNFLFQNDSFFVTKIKIDPQNEMYIRCSDKVVNAILTNALGPNKNFDINKITELEAKLITAFNDNVYNFMNVSIDNTAQQQSRKFDITHLTFYIRDKETNLGGKFIVSFPSQLFKPEEVVSTEPKFSVEYFNKSMVEVDLKIGTTSFSVGDLKNLEPEDIVVLDNSNIQNMIICYKGFEKEIRITPNPALIISVDSSEGEEDMAHFSAENLWDSIQVEMGAEFDKVKVSLGELKNIEQGLVVDVGSVYDNNITLKVEEKVIAMGELVIVNERYGVKINKIFAEPKPQVEQPQQPQAPIVENQMPQEQFAGEEMPPQDFAGEPMGEMMPEQVPQEQVGDDGDFDYSDFELEDEDI